MSDKAGKLISDLDDITSGARLTFGSLSAKQINWKPAPESWSVGQCFSHLITANSSYFSVVESIAAGGGKPNFWARVPGLPRFFGALILRAVQPENTRKSKAPKIFRPAQSDVSGNIIDEFAEHQERVKSLVQSCEKIDWDKTIISSPVAKFVVYSLKDAFDILVQHERRHFRQAERVMKTTGFPNL